MITDPSTGPGAGARQPSLPKVVAFITRDRGPDREILVVRQLASRPQLPTETVALDETPSQAAMRLAEDMADTSEVALRQRVAVVKETLEPEARIVLRPVLMRTGPSPDATLMRFTLERGMRVRLTDTHEQFVRVVYEEYALHESELAIATRRAGWVEAHSLTAVVDHHLFLLSAPPPSLESGTARLRSASAPQPVWVPLSRVSGLTPLHERWLERVHSLLNT